jgi:hypothetical protein
MEIFPRTRPARNQTRQFNRFLDEVYPAFQ